jgi:hypothetical protein
MQYMQNILLKLQQAAKGSRQPGVWMWLQEIKIQLSVKNLLKPI